MKSLKKKMKQNIFNQCRRNVWGRWDWSLSVYSRYIDPVAISGGPGDRLYHQDFGNSGAPVNSLFEYINSYEE